jgi:hypothetical protein
MKTKSLDLHYSLAISHLKNHCFHYILVILLSLFLAGCNDDGGGTDSSLTANAGADQSVTEGDLVQLTGTGSDPDGAVTFSWTQTSGPSVNLSNSTIANPTFTAPSVTTTESLEFTLTVTNTDGQTATDSVTISVSQVVLTGPTANAGADQTVTEGDPVQLSGTGSDPDGAVTFSWSQTSGPSVTLSDSTIANPTFTAPSVATTESLVFSLTVTDTDGLTATDSVSISINDSNTPGGTADTYLFYTHGLSAVDPSNPSSPILIEPTADMVSELMQGSAEIVKTGDYDGINKTYSNIHSYAVIYPKTDGHFYKVSALKSGSLTPVQVSSETQADQLCIGAMHGTGHFDDFSNPENSVYLYALPGDDSICETPDDNWKMIRLSMTSSVPPITAKMPVYPIDDYTTGSITGWLVHDAGALYSCNEVFADCTMLTSVTSFVEWATNTTEYILLNVDNQLYSYNIATNSLSATLFTNPNPSDFLTYNDGTTAFFGLENNLYQLSVDGSSDASVLSTHSADTSVVGFNDNQVIVELSQPPSLEPKEIVSVSKANGASQTLFTAPESDNLVILAVVGDLVYYQLQRTELTSGILMITPISAGVINVDGTPVSQTPDAAWSGVILNSTIDMKRGDNTGDFFDKIILAEGFNIPGTSGGFAGATISSVDAETAIPELNLGSLPTTEIFGNVFFGDESVGALTQATIYLDPQPAPPALPFKTDIFFIDPELAGSLTRVTNTPDEDELIIVF